MLAAGITTSIDFFVFNLIGETAGIGIIPSNIMSTTVGLFLGYFLQKRFVFRDRGEIQYRQFAKFVGFTMFSLYVIQSLVIWIVTSQWALPLEVLASVADFVRLDLLFDADIITRNSAKVLAGMTTAVINYFTYSRIVFASDEETRDETRDELWVITKLIGAFRW